MGATFDNNVTVTVTTDGAPIGRAGFGTPLVVDAAAMSERIRFYTSAAAAAADVTAGEITAAQGTAIALAFSQRVRPQRVAAGRVAAETAQVTTLTVGGTAVTGTYSFLVNGLLVDFAAVVPTNTNSDIGAGLRADATTVLAGSGITVTGATTSIILTGTAGEPFAVTALTAPGTGTLTQVTTNAVTIGDELDAIVAENGDWYGLTLVSRTKLTILHAAAWIETQPRIFVAQSSDADILTTANTDVAYDLEQLAYTRTALLYYPTNGTYADMAWLANRLSADLDVQQTVWYSVTLVGVTPTSSLSETQKTNVLNKNANLYLTQGGLGSTGDGLVASGQNIDEITTIDWVVARIREAITQLFLTESNALRKVPFTEEGFSQIASVVNPVLQRGVAAEHFTLSASGDGPFVDMPTLAEVDPADRAARLLRFSFYALLAGAIRSVSVSGAVTTSNATFEGFVASVEEV